MARLRGGPAAGPVYGRAVGSGSPAAALTLALLLERLQQAGPVRVAFATLLEPASEFGRAAMDELHQQTVNLLSFQDLPRAMYDAQAAYNLLSGLGESAKVSLSADEARIRRHYAALLPQAVGRRWRCRSSMRLSFMDTRSRLPVEMEHPVEVGALEEALSGDHVDLVLEDTDSPSNLAATGQNDVLVRLRTEQGPRSSSQASRLWLWAASDNLRLNAQNAVQCALDLRRLRPQGTVQ